jgi:protease IV
MKDSVLRQQWQFLLTSQIYRGMWFIHPAFAMSQGATLEQLMNRDWTGRDQATDLNNERTRAEFPVAAIAKSGEVFAGNESFDKAPSGSTAIIPIKGTMLKYGTMCTYGTEEIAGAALEAAAHKNISSIVLDIDSGGGAVDAVAPMVQAITKIRNQMRKPVVASCDLAASAAYWTASACSRIVANNPISAEFGSIGVMMSFADILPMYEKAGVKFHKIYAPESSWKNRPFELALEGKYEEIEQEELSPLAIAFQNAVKQNRQGKLKLDTPGLLNGRMFFAENAKDSTLNAKAVGLADETGSMDLAVQLARDMSKMAFVDNYIKS